MMNDTLYTLELLKQMLIIDYVQKVMREGRWLGRRKGGETEGGNEENWEGKKKKKGKARKEGRAPP